MPEATAHTGWPSPHVILKEFHHEKKTPYFLDYVKRYSDCPYLIELEEDGDHYKPGRLVRANRIAKYKDVNNGDWKFLNVDMESGEPVMPKGSAGHRWDKEQGNWNMKLEDGESHEPYDPLLTLLDHKDEVAQVVFTEFGFEHSSAPGRARQVHRNRGWTHPHHDGL